MPGHRVEVRLHGAERRYDIRVAAGLLGESGRLCRELLPQAAHILVLTDETVAGFYLHPVMEVLEAAGYRVSSRVLPPGESSKAMAQAEGVFHQLSEEGFSRQDGLLALGGGVIGDLGGFCASTWHRGMRLIQAPTTLIAQVDSSIGGKTAVNLPGMKNAVGTFYQPDAVWMDTDCLNTLPVAERRAGMAEVFKYSLIEISCTGETGFFDWLDDQAAQVEAVYPELVARCAAIKAAVVMGDETDTLGLRAFLNLGHTFGHAYEALSHYQIAHGDAVALGILDAVRLSVRLGMLSQPEAERIERLHRHLGLLQSVPASFSAPPEAVVEAMRKDKKAHAGRIQLVLPVDGIGRVCLKNDISSEHILPILQLPVTRA